MQKLCALCKKMIPKDDPDVYEEITTWVKDHPLASERVRRTGVHAHGACVRGEKPRVEVPGQEALPFIMVACKHEVRLDGKCLNCDPTMQVRIDGGV